MDLALAEAPANTQEITGQANETTKREALSLRQVVTKLQLLLAARRAARLARDS